MRKDSPISGRASRKIVPFSYCGPLPKHAWSRTRAAVGRTPEGNAIVLTNAHVAGTTRVRTVNVERWNTNGTSEKGTGTIIASRYGRGTSVDFALLKCSAAFAKDVDPIPLADRYPNNQSSVTTFGCPRCEWPSLQVLRLNRKEGQILSWKPEAIGGRSGSSLIDYTDEGPRVVGLLTWAGGGEGLGQSTPFLLSAMRGKLPTTLEAVGDVRQLLERHGWQRVRGGENEYWRRPGKEHGWSASLRNNQLFVFSSNAMPFEPERAYGPFSVYALLMTARYLPAGIGSKSPVGST